MRKFLLSILAAAAMTACKPEAYTGPLDSPVGNWDGVHTEYFFDGEMVAEAEGCQYSAISFYKDGLCCIEGVKGAFPYTYDPALGQLTVDKTVWSVNTLTGAEMVLEYIETLYPDPIDPEQEPDSQPDSNGVVLPVEYKGKTINADSNGYYYEAGNTDRIYCFFYGAKDEAGTLIIDFWYNSHVDHFIPLVVEVKK